MRKWVINQILTEAETVAYELSSADDQSTGTPITYDETPDIFVLLDHLINDEGSGFQKGDTIEILPGSSDHPALSATYFGGTAQDSVSVTKSCTIIGYGVTIKPSIDSEDKFMFTLGGDGNRLTMQGLTLDLGYNSTDNRKYAGAIYDYTSAVPNNDGIRLYDCTIKDTYDYGLFAGFGNQDTTTKDRIICENCYFTNLGALTAVAPDKKGSKHAMIVVNSIEAITLKNCVFHTNKLWDISARNTRLEHIYGDSSNPLEGPIMGEFEDVIANPIRSEYITLMDVTLNGKLSPVDTRHTGIKLRNFSSLPEAAQEPDFTYHWGTCKRCLVDGFTHLGQSTGGNAPITIEPGFSAGNDISAFSMENVVLRNIQLGDKGIHVRTYDYDGLDTATGHGKIGILDIEDMTLKDFDVNSCLLLVKNCDIDRVSIRNAKPIAAWAANGSVIVMNKSKLPNLSAGPQAGGDVNLKDVDISGLVTEPVQYLVSVVDDESTSTRTASAVFRRSLDNGAIAVRYGGAGPASTASTSVKFREMADTVAVPSGSTFVTVTHNLSYTPRLQDIQLTATNSMNNAGKVYASTPTATTFRITVNTDPGAGGATFAWAIRRN